MYIWIKKKKKKKNPDLPTHFFWACYSKHNFFFRLIQNSFVAMHNKICSGAKTFVGSGNLKHISGLDMHWNWRTRQAFPFKRKLYLEFVYSKFRTKLYIASKVKQRLYYTCI